MFSKRTGDSKRRVSICREGWYYLVVLWFIIGGAMMRDINLLLVLAGMMLGPLLISWYLIRATLKRLEIRRKLPDAVSAGDLLVVDIVGTNKRRRLDSWAVIVEDQIQCEGPAGDAETVTARTILSRISPGQTLEASYRGRLYRRGLYRFGPLKISTRIPLGLLRGTRIIAESNHVLVCPRLGRLSPHWARTVQPDRIGSQRSKHRQGLLEGDFYGLRDWRTGDSRRWIHWRTSARRNQLAVRQFEQQRNQDLTVMLDLHHRDADSPQSPDDIELAISFVATVVADQCRRGSSDLLIGVAGQQLAFSRGISSSVMLQEVMQHLAAAKPSHNDCLPELVDQVLSRIKPGTRTVVVSTRHTDLSDTDRFAAAWDDPRHRTTLGRIVCVNVNSSQFERVFQVDPL